jgi:hypothetical protein
MYKFYPAKLIFSSSTSASLWWPLSEYTDPFLKKNPMFLAVLYAWGRQWPYCLYCAWRHVEELRYVNTFHTFWFHFYIFLPYNINLNFPTVLSFQLFLLIILCASVHLHHPAVHVRETLRNDQSFLRSLLKLSLWFNPYLYRSGEHKQNAEANCIKETLKDILFTG